MPRTARHKRLLVCEAIAFAALAEGPWTEEALVERIASAFERSPQRWMRTSASRVLARFAEPPLDPEALVAVLHEIPALSRVRAPIRRWLVPRATQRSHAALPPLATHADVAALLALPLRDLPWFADVQGRNPRESAEKLGHYTYRWITKRSGRLRLIESPKTRLKEAQRRLLSKVLDSIPVHDAAFGFVAGRSVHDHAARHAGRAVVIRVDLEDFFWQIGFRRAEGLFRSLGLSRSVASVLGGVVCTATPHRALASAPGPLDERIRLRHLRHPHLPQGAPTSPAIANLCARGLDRRLSGLAARFGARYSRYADDLVFSGDRFLRRDARVLLAWIEAIVEDEGFTPNRDKTRVMGAEAQQRVGGLVVNTQPAVPRRERDRLEAILVSCLRDGPAAANRDGHGDFRAHLRGRVDWVTQAHPRHGAALRARFDAIRWPDEPVGHTDPGDEGSTE